MPIAFFLWTVEHHLVFGGLDLQLGVLGTHYGLFWFFFSLYNQIIKNFTFFIWAMPKSTEPGTESVSEFSFGFKKISFMIHFVHILKFTLIHYCFKLLPGLLLKVFQTFQNQPTQSWIYFSIHFTTLALILELTYHSTVGYSC